jgi:ribosomal protein S27E
MVTLIPVHCPTCRHEQSEPEGTISTICEKCRSYIPLEAPEQKILAVKPKRTRQVFCPHCETPQKVYPHAITTMCVGCGSHLNIANHTVSGRARHSLSTFGDVTFTRGCRYSGAEVRAQVIYASGELQTRLKAYRELVFSHHVTVTGSVSAPQVIVMPGASVRARRLSASLLIVRGYISVETKQLVIEPGGYLACQQLKSPDLDIQLGGGLEADYETIAPLEPV